MDAASDHLRVSDAISSNASGAASSLEQSIDGSSVTATATSSSGSSSSLTHSSSSSSRRRSRSASALTTSSDAMSDASTAASSTIAPYGYTTSTLVTSSDATFWQALEVTARPVNEHSPGVALAAAVAGTILVLGLLTALMLFAHYRRQSRLGRGYERLQRGCASACCGCCWGARTVAGKARDVEKTEKLASPADANTSPDLSTIEPVTEGTAAGAQRSLEAGEGRQQLARHARSASNTLLRHTLGLALPPAVPISTVQGRARRPLARKPTLESLSELSEPPLSANRLSTASVGDRPASEAHRHSTAGSHYEDATDSLPSANPGNVLDLPAAS